MKNTSHRSALQAVLITTLALGATSPSAFSRGSQKYDKYDENGNDASNSEADLADNYKIPADPVGWITANPTVVQTGTYPTLTWSITYPSVVKDYVEIVEPGTVRLTETVDVEIRVLGNGVTASSGNSYSYTFVNAEAWLNFDGGGWTRIFNGDNHDVNPSRVVWSRTGIGAGDTLNFGGRYFYNGYGPFRHSTDGNKNVRVLVAGDEPPSNVPGNDAPSLEDFIKPYLGADGKVNIGPMDVIVFMELTHSDSQQNEVGYDLQDMVLLVTFSDNGAKNDNNTEDHTIDSNGTFFMEYDTASR